MKFYFGGTPMFNGKKHLKVFSWLQKLVKACDDNDVSKRMGLYLIPNFLAAVAERRFTRNLPGSEDWVGRGALGTFPVAVNGSLSTYAEPHALGLAQEELDGRHSLTTRGWTPSRCAYGASPSYAATFTPRGR